MEAPPSWAAYRPWLAGLPDPSAAGGRVPGSCPTGGAVNLTGTTLCVVSVWSNFTTLNVQDNATLVLQTPASSPPITVSFAGSITLKGHGTLFVNRTDLVVRQAYNREFSLLAQDQARVIVLDSNVSANGFVLSGAGRGSSNLTVLGSNFCYPLSTGWFTDSVLDGSKLNLLQDDFSADVILLDNPAFPSTASFHASQANGFNLWLNFKAGSRVNTTLPGELYTGSWAFPGGRAVSGVNYTVGLANCQVIFFAAMLWQWSNVTFTDSPDLVLSFNVQSGVAVFRNLSEAHYGVFGYYRDGFGLHLSNSTVFTWNIYPLAGTTVVWDAQVGEIQLGTTSALATVHRGNLTGHGGYYGDQGTSSFTLFDSTLASQLVDLGGPVRMVNCSVNTTVKTPGFPAVFAANNGALTAVDTWLARQDVYQVAASSLASITIAWTLHVNATVGGLPAPGAQVSVDFVDAGAPRGGTSLTADAQGAASTPLTARLLTSGGSAPKNTSDQVSATQGLNGTLPWVLGALTAPVWVDLRLNSFLLGTVPADGATGVPTLSTMEVLFRYPMAPAPTLAAVNVTPGTSYQGQWDAPVLNLTLTPALPLAYGTLYTIRVLPGATTAQGEMFGSTFSFSFTTVAPPPLQVSLGANATGGPVGTPVVLTAAATGGAGSYVFAWSLNGTNLTGSAGSTYTAQPPHPGNYTYGVWATDVIGEAARAVPVVLTWTPLSVGGPPPTPAVVQVVPANGTLLVDRGSSVTVVLSVPMDPTLLRAAFSLAPAVGPGTVSVNATTVTWTPASSSLPANTTITVTLAASAESTQGVPLAHAFQSWFRTAPAASPPPGGNGTGKNGSASPIAPTLLLVLGAGVLLVVLATVALLARSRRGKRGGGKGGPPAPEASGAAAAGNPTPTSPSAPSGGDGGRR